MRMVLRSAPSADIGVAIGPDRITAMRLGHSAPPSAEHEPWSRPLDPGVLPQSLGEALPELQAALGLRQARLWVVLLPPLVELKRLELPRLSRDELERVIARDANRYFLTGTKGQAVVAVSLPPTRARGMTPMLAALAQIPLLEQLADQVAGLGWSLERITPACTAWAALAGRTRGRATGIWIAVALSDSLELLHVEDGRIAAVRRLPLRLGPRQLGAEVAASVRAAATAAAGADEPGELLVLAPTEIRDELTRSFTACGLRTTDSGPQATARDPDLVAALHARGTDPLDLVPPTAAEAHRRRAVRLTRIAAGAAAALLVMAGGLEWWGVRRELDQVIARRHSIHAQVTQAMSVRSSIEDLDHRVAALQSAESRRPTWSATMGTLASTLPPDAHLIAWRADADTLRVEGLADRAAGVFEGLARMTGVAGVRADAPVRQETRDSAPPLEHFLLSARLASTGDTAVRR
jgi:hypothetical protein